MAKENLPSKIRLEIHFMSEEWTPELSKALDKLRAASTLEPARYSFRSGTLYEEGFSWDGPSWVEGLLRR